MTAKDFIVAIELGSSKITGIAGKKNSDGSIQVLAYAREEASAFIRKGIIYNINKTALGLTSIINKLEEQLEAKIAKVYVGLGGQSLHSKKNFVVDHLGREIIITPDIVTRLIQNNQQTRYQDLDILDVVPQEYKVKNDNLADPVGVVGSQIEGHFLNIVARSSVKRNLLTCFEQAGIEIAGFLIAPLVLADAVLTDIEKRSGCVLVDLGAETTTVAVYKNNVLRHVAVIPLGGNNITKDICSLQIEEGEAETLKCKYGSAFTLPGVNTDDDEYPVNETHKIKANLLNDVVGARVEEIIANVMQQIKKSGYMDKLPCGIVLTGGGANLRNLQEAFTQQLKNKYVKVRIANFVLTTIKATESEILIKNGQLNTLYALLAAGKENCCLPEKEEPANDLFLQAQMEEQKKKEEEAARLAAIEREKREQEAAAKAAAAEEAELQRKAAEEARNKANAKALSEMKETAEAMKQAVEKISEAKLGAERAKREKDSKKAKDASDKAQAALDIAQSIQAQAQITLGHINDEAFLNDARTIYAEIQAKAEAIRLAFDNIRKIKDEVKSENSFLGRLGRLGDIIMND